MYLINTNNLCHVASHKGLNTDLNINAIVQKHYWRQSSMSNKAFLPYFYASSKT